MTLAKIKLDYKFKDKDLLVLALTHKSASKDNNERLEFLGDAILNLYIAITVFKKFNTFSEGKLTQIRASLVSRYFLNSLGEELELSNWVILGKGESTKNNSIVGNAFEAIIGAIYLDAGMEEVQKFLDKLFLKRINNIEPDKEIRDFKSQLQERLQKNGFRPPVYEVISHGDSVGETRFEILCKVEDLDLSAKGWGKNRKIAEQEAASIIIQLYLNNDK